MAVNTLSMMRCDLRPLFVLVNSMFTIKMRQKDTTCAFAVNSTRIRTNYGIFFAPGKNYAMPNPEVVFTMVGRRAKRVYGSLTMPSDPARR
jgi:hypothetical protein